MTNIPDARITSTEVWIGDQKLPGPIMESGVTIEPGGTTHANRVTVTFIVGRVEVENNL
jgi:hypothetical protein